MADSHKPSGMTALVLLSVMMFLEFFVWGAWYVTMGPFMAAQDMDGDTIGLAYSMGPIAAIISPFFLGLVADRFFSSERVLATMHLLGGVILCAAPWAAGVSPEAFIAVILAHMLCYMPTLGLTNTVAFHNIGSAEKHFPLVRVFGTIGWIVANLVISWAAFDTSANMFYVAGGAAVLLGAFSFVLPHTPPPAKGKAFSVRDALGLDALRLLKDRSFAVFALCSFLICIPLAAYYAFAGQFAGEMGFEKIAQTMSFGQMSEIFFMLVMPLFFARLGVKWMLLIGMAAWVTRYGLFSGAADEQVKWMVLSGIILHGICYDFFFVTGQIYVDNAAGAKIRGAAQGFLVLITQGLGMFIGALAAGRLVTMNTFGALIGQDGSAITDAPRLPAGTEVAVRDGAAVVIDGAGNLVEGHGIDPALLTGAGIVDQIDWQSVWIAPAAFAGAIMIVFFVLFKNPKRNGATAEQPLPEDPPAAASGAE